VRSVLTPVTVGEMTEMISDARRSSQPLWFQGSGTDPVPEDHTVVTSKALKGVVDYKPDDLTIVVRAGTTLAELDAVLSEHGHSAILPETSPDRTVGGVVASGASGYRRLRYGPTRDRVIGVTVVTGYGEIVRGGGQLVKNVTGYDMSRLMTGSHGALGFIAEVSLKLWPVETRRATVVVEDVGAAWPKLYQPVAALESESDGLLYVAGSEGSVASQIGGTGGTELEGFAWPDPLDLDVVVAVNVPPRLVSEAIGRVRSVGADRFVAQHGVGVVDVGWSDVKVENVVALRAWAQDSGGSVVIHRCGSLGDDAAKWGAVPGTVAVQRRLKHLFDPDRVCNPGVLSRDV
jgi:glycolate oxidase FAD binding subunit